jgi:hypothetical protein
MRIFEERFFAVGPSGKLGEMASDGSIGNGCVYGDRGPWS